MHWFRAGRQTRRPTDRPIVIEGANNGVPADWGQHQVLPEGKTWGERLVPQRTALGITQAEWARRIGVDQGTLAKWERGDREPKGEMLSG